MTEAQWLACDNPAVLLEFLGDRLDNRRLRLFACACCRRVWGLLADDASRRGVEASEAFADGAGKLRDAYADASRVAAVRTPYVDRSPQALAHDAAFAAAEAAGRSARRAAALAMYRAGRCFPPPEPGRDVEGAAQAGLLRDIAPSPFLASGPGPGCLTPTVVSLARAAYAERVLPPGELEPARLAVLADALEEAGCSVTEVLDHLRSTGPHVRGCWAVDLCLGLS